jgi:DNA polymerase
MGITLWEQRWSPQQVVTKDDPKVTQQSHIQQASAAPPLTAPADQTVTLKASLNEPPETDHVIPTKPELTNPAPQGSLDASLALFGDQDTTSQVLHEVDERAMRISQMDWGSLKAEVSGCIACELHKSRTQTVFGVGDRQAAWMIIGEAPGADEDRLGEPFLGRAGKLLDAMLQALGLHREKVFIANILKCRPPKNRDPSTQEADCCQPYLKRQISLINPRIILAVGRIAAQNLLQTDLPVGKLRSRVHRLSDMEIPVVVSYHPAYLLRSPREKRKAWDDLQLAQRIVSHASDMTAG